MRDGILKAQDEAEQAGDWGLLQPTTTKRCPMPANCPIRKPTSQPHAISSGPSLRHRNSRSCLLPCHYEFLLQYQIPIMEKFALSAYGCCEDLTEKVDMLRWIPNSAGSRSPQVADVRRVRRADRDQLHLLLPT